MSNRKSTTARTVYRSPEGRVIVERTEDADYILSVDDCCAGVYTNAHAAEVAGLVELEYRVRQERWLAATEAEAAYYAGRMAAARASASPAEALAAIADLDYEDRLRADAEDAELAARNFSDEAAEAYQQAYRSGAQAMDASMDMTCYCELCGGAVMPDEAALVGEQMACGWCAGKAQGIARFIARHGHAPGEPDAPSTGPRLLWSWAGNATALGAVVSERRAAWMAQQQRWLLAADAAGLAAAEHYEAK